MFTPLHIHTDASLLDGIGQAEAYAARAKQLGLSAMSVTDHGSLAGVPEMVAACRRHGLKPILGMEAYVAIGSRHEHNSVETLGVDADGEKAKFNEHLTLIAATRKGWRNLVALHNTSWESVWRGKPRIDWDLLAEHAEGLICLTGCLGGPVLGPMVQGRRAKARANLERIIAIFGPERTFVEVMEHGIERESAVLGDVAALAADGGVRCVATCDCHYVDEADALAHEAWLAKQRRMTLADERRWRFPGGGYHLMGEEQMRSLRPEPWWGQAVSNTALVEAMVEGDVMPDYRVRLPQPPVPDGFKDVTAWVVDWAKKGSAARYGSPMPEQVRARLNAEIKVFKAKGMVGYAALVGEMIAWAKDQGIEVGPGRGSAGGSVLLYCLGITDVDPLASGTIFARFLDPERAGLPDVDTDFERGRREEVYQHLVDTYGSDQVVRLGTATISGTKASLKDACSQVGIENAWANRLTKTIPGVGDDIPSLDSLLRDPVGEEFRKVLATCPGEREAMLGLARSFEGVRSALSIHACGVVVADENLRDLVPMRLDTATGSWVSVWDGPTCEAMGLVKLDLLGLRTLDQIRAACTIAGIEPHQVPRGDQVGAEDPVWDMLARGETASVFQLESGGMADLCSRLEPHGEDDLTALGALYRPGPMGIGMHLDYADRRTGRAEVSYAAFTADPDEARALESVLGRTFGLIVYQEQIMDLGRLVGGFTASGTNALRKAVAKKHPEEIERLGVLFADGAVRETDDDGNPKHVFARTTAHRLWEAIKSAGKYCFNLSHSVAYGRLTFTTAWLKAHYPAAFGAATLAVTDAYERRVAAMGWMARGGITITPPQISRAQVTTTAVDETTVVLGLGEVKGVGGVADQIVAERASGPYTSITNLTERMRARGVSLTAAAVEALVKAGALDEFGPRAGLASAARALMRGPAPVPDIEWEPVTRAKAQLSVLGTATGDDLLAEQSVRDAVRQWRHAGGGKACHIRALERVPLGDFVAVAGTVTSVEHKIGATWRLRVLTLTEEESHIEVACWGQLCDATASITPGAVVVVYGGLRTSSDGQGSQFSTWGVDVLPVAEGVTRLPRSEAVDSLIARLAQSSQH